MPTTPAVVERQEHDPRARSTSALIPSTYTSSSSSESGTQEADRRSAFDRVAHERTHAGSVLGDRPGGRPLDHQTRLIDVGAIRKPWPVRVTTHCTPARFEVHRNGPPLIDDP